MKVDPVLHRLHQVLDTARTCSGNMRRDDGVRGLLSALAGLVRCDVLFWNAYRLTPFSEIGLVPGADCDPPRAPLEGWLDHLHEHPVMSGRYGPVVAVSDVVPRREFERTWMYQHALRPAGVRHEIGLELSHRHEEMSIVVLSRTSGRDFSADDHLLLDLVRPHIDAAVRRLTRPLPRLTPRQVQVLLLVRQGLTDLQVARHLGLAETTVGKHLEGVYARTGARNRVQAVDLCSDLLRGAVGVDHSA